MKGVGVMDGSGRERVHSEGFEVPTQLRLGSREREGRSDQVADGSFGAGHRAGGLGFPDASGVEGVGDGAILVVIHLGEEIAPETAEFVGFQAALEEAVLDPDAVVLTDLGDAVETFCIRDVVGDEIDHLMGSWRFGLVGGDGEGAIPPVIHGDGAHSSV